MTPRTLPLCTFGPARLISMLALAVGCSSGGTVSNAGGSAAAGGMTQAAAGGSSATGGLASSGLGGTSTQSVGGTQASGGTSARSGGGTQATGGTTAVSTGGNQVTGGKASTSSTGTGGRTSVAGGATSAASGGTPSTAATSGTKTTGGATANSTSSTGGVTNAGGGQTGGTKASGGASQSSTGGTKATGGAGSSTVPTGLPSNCGSADCDAATPVNPQLTSYGALGNVTEYSTSASNGGACLYGSTSVMYYAAINANLSAGDGKGQWQGGAICGQCMEVTVLTSTGTKSVVVRIMDECPDGFCGIDLGGTAPSVVMSDGMGRYQGAWRAVSCAGHSEVSDGVPSVHVKDGASGGWSVIQVRNPTTGVAGIDWQYHGDPSTHGTLALDTTGINNYYDVPLLVLQAIEDIDFTIRYVDGTTATVTLTTDQLATPEGTYPLN